MAFSPDAKLLASAAANEGTVRLWDIATGRELRTIKAHTGTIKRDLLWECPYTHRVHVRLGTLLNDISEAINAYIAELEYSADLQNKFERCLRYLYPIDA